MWNSPVSSLERPVNTPTVHPNVTLQTDYYAVVRRPISLEDMLASASSGRYTLSDIQRDIRRMIANAKKYNKPEAVVYQDSLELEVSWGHQRPINT